MIVASTCSICGDQQFLETWATADPASIPNSGALPTGRLRRQARRHTDQCLPHESSKAGDRQAHKYENQASLQEKDFVIEKYRPNGAHGAAARIKGESIRIRRNHMRCDPCPVIRKPSGQRWAPHQLKSDARRCSLRPAIAPMMAARTSAPNNAEREPWRAVLVASFNV